MSSGQLQQLVLCKYFKKNNFDHTVELEMAQTRTREINQIPHNHLLLMVSIVFAKLLILIQLFSIQQRPFSVSG